MPAGRSDDVSNQCDRDCCGRLTPPEAYRTLEVVAAGSMTGDPDATSEDFRLLLRCRTCGSCFIDELKAWRDLELLPDNADGAEWAVWYTKGTWTLFRLERSAIERFGRVEDLFTAFTSGSLEVAGTTRAHPASVDPDVLADRRLVAARVASASRD